MPSSTPQSLRVGAAQVDITPTWPAHVSGAVCEHRPANFVLDPIYAKVIVFESGGRRLCIVALDVTIITEEYTPLIRQAAVERFGFDADAVMVHATQTHTAPSVGYIMMDRDFPRPPAELEWLLGAEERYSRFAAERVIEAIGLAVERLAPAQIAAGSGIEGRFAYNRRAVTRDGSVIMPPRTFSGSTNPHGIRYLEGPIDPEVGVLCVRGESLAMPAMLLHHTCHPVHVFPRQIVSADWPGAWGTAMQQAFGQECVPLVVNGACGNINPWAVYDPDYVEDHRRMGQALADVTLKVMEMLHFTGEAELDWRVRHIRIPYREVDPELMQQSARMMTEHPEPLWADEAKTQVQWEWMRAASIYSIELARRRSACLDYEVQVLRIGDTAIVGLPGEPFVEGQLAIKLASPAFPTFIAHCTTQYVGYIPIRDAFARGGHEASPVYWSKLAPEALDMIVETVTEMLQEVFGKVKEEV